MRPNQPSTAPPIAAFILAGGLSTRMGRDKARLQLGRRTMLGHVRAAAAAISIPSRVIRTDVVSRCGPLGGIITGFRRSRSNSILFLACDMPLIRPQTLRKLISASDGGRDAVFATSKGKPGFPLILPRSALEAVNRQRRAGSFSLHELARTLKPRFVRISLREASNVNAPVDLNRLRRRPA